MKCGVGSYQRPTPPLPPDGSGKQHRREKDTFPTHAHYSATVKSCLCFLSFLKRETPMIKRDKNTSRRACFSPAQEKEIWAWNLEVSHYLRYLFPTTAMVVAMMSNANAGCDTYITLTANGAPAFTTVSSVIYDDNGSFVMAENRHSYTAELPCGGTYTLVSGDRSRKFQAGATFSMNVGGAE